MTAPLPGYLAERELRDRRRQRVRRRRRGHSGGAAGRARRVTPTGAVGSKLKREDTNWNQILLIHPEVDFSSYLTKEGDYRSAERSSCFYLILTNKKINLLRTTKELSCFYSFKIKQGSFVLHPSQRIAPSTSLILFTRTDIWVPHRHHSSSFARCLPKPSLARSASNYHSSPFTTRPRS